MQSDEISLIVNGQTIKCCSVNGVDFDLHENHTTAAQHVALSDLVEALKSRIQSHRPASIHDSFVVGALQESLGSITMYDEIVFPWDDTEFVYIDLVDGGKYQVTFYFITLIASSEEAVRSTCEPIISRHGFYPHRIEETQEGLASSFDEGTARSWLAECTAPLSSHTLGDINALRRELSYSAFFADGRLMHPELVVDLLQSGLASRLLERPESLTLEAKSSAYDLKKEPYWKIELAQDVASFANAERGGVLIIGIRTKKDPQGKDILKDITPIPPNGGRIQQYANVLHDRIYPPIDGLKIDTVPEENGELLYILVPAQREERKPFIVQGAAIDGAAEGYAFSIPRRRGDRNMWLQGRDLHSMIAIGRAILRTGRMDPRQGTSQPHE